MMRMYSSRLFDCLYDSGWLSSSLNPLMYRFHPQNLGSHIDHPHWHEVIYEYPTVSKILTDQKFKAHNWNTIDALPATDTSIWLWLQIIIVSSKPTSKSKGHEKSIQFSIIRINIQRLSTDSIVFIGNKCQKANNCVYFSSRFCMVEDNANLAFSLLLKSILSLWN